MTTIGVDLGGTKVLAAVVKRGAVVVERKRPTPEAGPAAVVAAIAELVDELGGADRVGIGTPGQVGHDGTVTGAPNMAGWDRPVPLGLAVADACRLAPHLVRVDNDVNVATLAEHHAGAGVGTDDMLGVFMGTGVGGGLVLDGSLRRGPHGSAGEFGHMVHRPGGRRCACGFLGHVEAYAGRAAIEAEARRRHAAGTTTELVALAGDGRMRSGVLARALASGDPLAIELLDEAVVAVAAAIASTAMLVDLERVVIGGGVAEKLGPPFVDRIGVAVGSLLPSGWVLPVVPSVLGDHAGVVGAAALAKSPR